MNFVTEAGRLLDQLDVVRRPCDLDLLVFFARHPRTLLSSDQIAAFLGYAVKDVATSLEVLLAAEFVTRTPNPRHVARLYVLAAAPPGGGWLPTLTRLATSREGRLALIEQIRHRASSTADPSTQQGHRGGRAVSSPLAFPQGRSAVKVGPRQGSAGTGALREPWQANRQGGGR